MQKIDKILGATALEPRPYQRRIVGTAVDMFRGRYRNGTGDTEKAARSVMVESPTGSGKTPMGLLTAKVLQEETGCRVGWVAMRRNLLAQARRENELQRINVQGVEFISMFDKDPPRGIDLLVVDEAQHDAASSMAHLHNLLKPKYILGLTATPFRTDRVKLCFDKVIKDAGIHQLICEGYLSQYHHYTIPNWNPETVVEQYVKDPKRWGKSLMFFHQLHQCRKALEGLQLAGIKCDVVTGDSDREEQLAMFHEGEYNVLINCAVLTEGFDCPDLQTVFCRDSGRGCTIQMAGRVFRKHSKVPYKQVVQSKLTRWPMLKTAMPKQQFLWQTDEWRSLTINPELDNINQAARLAIAQTEVNLPKWLLSRQDKKKNRWPPARSRGE